MAVIALDLGVRLARRHHDGASGLAFCWPRPVLLVEADPTGGSGILAGFLRGTTRVRRRADRARALTARARRTRCGTSSGRSSPNVSFVAGTRSHAQASGTARPVGATWPRRSRDLDATGQDVIVDAGRLGLVGLARAAARRRRRDSAGHPRHLPAHLGGTVVGRDASGSPATGWRQPGLLLIGEGQPYRASEVAKVLGLPVVADLPDDPSGRRCLSPRRRTRPSTSRPAPTSGHSRQQSQSIQAHDRPRSDRAGRGGHAHDRRPTASASEYGDLAAPAALQPADPTASTPAAARLRTPRWPSPPRQPRPTSTGRWSPTLRAQASEQLSQAVAADRGRLDKAAQQELGRSIVLDLIESAMADDVERRRRGLDARRSSRRTGAGGLRLAVPARSSPAARRRRPGREHHHHRPRQRAARADRRLARSTAHRSPTPTRS